MRDAGGQWFEPQFIQVCIFFLEKLYLIVEELVGRDIYFLCYFDFFSNFYFLEIDF